MSPFTEQLVRLHAAGARLVYVVTDEEERAVELCRAAFRPGGATAAPEVAVWSCARGLDPLRPAARSGAAVLEALADRRDRPVVALLLDFHRELEDRAVARRLRDLLASAEHERCCLVIVAPRLQLPEGLSGEAAVLRLPLPDRDELAAALERCAGSARPPGATAYALVTAATGLTRRQAERAFRGALAEDPAGGDEALQVVLRQKQRLLAEDRGLELVEAAERPEDLGGLESFKAWLAERALAFAPDAASYGLSPPRGVMLLGVQGCGKSLAAKAVAGLLRVPLLRLDLPRVFGAGEGAQEGLTRALESAEALAPVALWVDEIEKCFAGSGGSAHDGDARAARLLGAFSTWLQERRTSVFVVATANAVARLPPELLRRGRFDELFFVDLPDEDARQAILGLHLGKRGRDPERFDLVAVAGVCAGYSGAELEQVVVGALHRAYHLGREVETQDLRRVAQELVPLYRTYEEEIKALREWARGRARPAARESAVADLFRRTGS